MYSEKQLKIILQTKNYHSIFVHLSKIEKASLFIEKNNEVFKNLEEYCIMIPSIYEINQDKSDLIYKFNTIFKNFIENEQQKTLIVIDLVLNALIKEEKREAFFKFLLRKNKNILLFTTEDYEKYIKNIPSVYYSNILSEEKWNNKLEMFYRFDLIKNFTIEAYEPFKTLKLNQYN